MAMLRIVSVGQNGADRAALAWDQRPRKQCQLTKLDSEWDRPLIPVTETNSGS